MNWIDVLVDGVQWTGCWSINGSVMIVVMGDEIRRYLVTGRRPQALAAQKIRDMVRERNAMPR